MQVTAHTPRIGNRLSELRVNFSAIATFPIWSRMPEHPVGCHGSKRVFMNKPIHGDQSWKIGHIDHTQLDIEIVRSRTGQNRPRLTFLTDARTRQILGLSVSLSDPGAEACRQVLRDSVRFHHRHGSTG